MGLTNWSDKEVTSDYGSGSSMNSTSSWSSRERPKSLRLSSFLDLVAGGTTESWDPMVEFRANGIDSPYYEDEKLFGNRAGVLSGTVTQRTLRQYSCPERIPETRTRPVSWLPSPTANEFVPQHQPAPDMEFHSIQKPTNFGYPVQNPQTDALDAQIAKFSFPSLDDGFSWLPMKDMKNSPMEVDNKPFENDPYKQFSVAPIATSTPIDNIALGMGLVAPRPVTGVKKQWGGNQYGVQASALEEETDVRGVTETQLRVLRSLPKRTVQALLRQLKTANENGSVQPASPRRRIESECRFCKNNGERETYFKSHSLKNERGAVVCPVLRAYICGRCGATGDKAHTAKYCPLATAEDRMKSAAMMRSIRQASARRRMSAPPDYEHYMLFGESPSPASPAYRYDTPPLSPAWADLAKKLSVSS